ncbi:MAG: Flagellar assembly protein FliH [Phycisphaerales bacterium]|nr:Flagellar assembly protein FliH [Phycisphaerales bacterium]
MPVIRADKLPATAQAFSMQDVEQAAKRVLLKAKLQAGQLVEAAIAEGERLKAEAHAEGSRAGFEHGHAEGVRHGQEAGRDQAMQHHSAELSAVVRALTAVGGEVDAHRAAWAADGVREMVRLAVGIARRVTKRIGCVDPGVLEANLAEVLKLVAGAGDLRVAVHPDQRALLDACLPKLQLEWPDLKHVELIEDPAVSPGGCRVYTRGGFVDADLDAQLDRVIGDLLPLERPPAATDGPPVPRG